MKINNDPKIIDELLSRSIANIYPNKEEFRKALLSGKRLKIYIGADATGPKLHIGHATNFMILEKLRRLGHEIIVLFGDFTGKIGDPSGKDSARKQLSEKDIRQNLKTWKRQVDKIIKFGTFGNGAKIVRNSKWLSKLSFEEVLNLASKFTVQQMVERDMYQKRLKEKKPIYLNEFFYPLMQGYDSVALNVDVEIGGNDQTFNMLAGRTLQNGYNNKEKFVIATTLLVNPKTGGKLMNKSEGNVVGLDDDYRDMFGKVMSLPDEAIISLFTDCTYVSMEKIEFYKKQLEEGVNPKDIKMILAESIVSVYYGEKKAKEAKDNFQKTFSEKSLAPDAKEVHVSSGISLVDVLLKENIVSSKTDFRRLVESGAVNDLNTSQKIEDPFYKIEKNLSLRIGKHRFVNIILDK